MSKATAAAVLAVGLAIAFLGVTKWNKLSHKLELEKKMVKMVVIPTAIYTAKPGDLVEEKGCWNYITSNGLDSTNSVSQIRIKPLCGGMAFPVYQYNLANVSEVISFEKDQERWVEIVHQQYSK